MDRNRGIKPPGILLPRLGPNVCDCLSGRAALRFSNAPSACGAAPLFGAAKSGRSDIGPPLGVLTIDSPTAAMKFKHAFEVRFASGESIKSTEGER
jgi:hypothetical protein